MILNTTESIIEAAKIAWHDFIMSLGKGYATSIAEEDNLSGVKDKELL